MFGPRPRSVRDFLNDQSAKALVCAVETGSGGSRQPEAAAGARIASALLADVRDALDLGAPWLMDKPQVLSVLTCAESATERCTFKIGMSAISLTDAVAAAARVIAEPVEDDEEEDGGASEDEESAG